MPHPAFWHCQADMGAVNDDRLVFARGEGCYLWDVEGRRYFDAPASLWYCNVGHGRAEIADAVADQIRRLESYSSFGRFTTDVTLRLADRVADLVPLDDPAILLTSGGGDGIDLAAKLVRRYWAAVGRAGKKTIVTRDLSYHGLHAFGTSITGLPANREGVGRLVPEAVTVPTHDLAAVKVLFAEHGSTIAAFFTEPVLGTGGVIPPQPGYFAGLRRLCNEYDVLLVADEVITGFGRLGQWFGSTVVGLEPDVMVLAKGISSGYVPLGAVAVGPRVSEPFWGPRAIPFRHGMTYAGHSAACAAGLANIDILEREDLLSAVRDRSVTLTEATQQLRGMPGVVEVRGGVGLMAGIQMRSPALADAVAARCLGEGYIVRPITNGTLQLSPPFVVTDDEIRAVVSVIADQVTQLAISDQFAGTT